MSFMAQEEDEGRTYSSGLPLAREELELLVVPELDHDIDGPLLVVLFLADADLASTANAVKGSREFVADTLHKLDQLGMPVVLCIVQEKCAQ